MSKINGALSCSLIVLYWVVLYLSLASAITMNIWGFIACFWVFTAIALDRACAIYMHLRFGSSFSFLQDAYFDFKSLLVSKEVSV